MVDSVDWRHLFVWTVTRKIDFRNLRGIEMKTSTNVLWLALAIVAALGLLSAPITYGFGEDAFSVSVAISGVAITLLLLMAILTLWVEGARANSGILFGVFLGLVAAGGLAFAFDATDLALMAGSAGATGIIVTGIFASPGKRVTVTQH